jgi:hypothetical protein
VHSAASAGGTLPIQLSLPTYHCDWPIHQPSCTVVASQVLQCVLQSATAIQIRKEEGAQEAVGRIHGMSDLSSATGLDTE